MRKGLRTLFRFRIKMGRTTAMAVIAAAGLALTISLAFETLLPCSLDACRTAAQVRLFSLPVWSMGFLFYVSFLLILVVRPPWTSILAAAASGVEIFLLRTMVLDHILCPLCLLNAAIVTGLLLLSLQKERLPLCTAIAFATLSLLLIFIPSLETGRPNRAGTVRAVSSPVVATVAGQTITLGDVDARIQEELRSLKEEMRNARLEALTAMIDERILHEELHRRHLSAAELYRAVTGQVSITPQEVNFFYENNRDIWDEGDGGGEPQVRQAMKRYLIQEKRQDLWRHYLRDLWKRYAVTVEFPQDEPSRRSLPMDGDLVFGPERASVTIIEYADYCCPVCRAAHEVITELMKRYDGRVRWIFKDFPIPYHEHAMDTAEAARCAAEQGRFLDYRNLLFSRSDQLRFQREDFTALALELGLDTQAFAQCLDTHRYREKIRKERDEAEKLGIDAVPSFIINGEKVVGFPGRDVLLEMIETPKQAVPATLASLQIPHHSIP